MKKNNSFNQVPIHGNISNTPVNSISGMADTLYPVKAQAALSLLIADGALVTCNHGTGANKLDGSNKNISVGGKKALSINDTLLKSGDNFFSCTELTKQAQDKWKDNGEKGDKPTDVPCEPDFEDEWTGADATCTLNGEVALHRLCKLKCKKANGIVSILPTPTVSGSTNTESGSNLLKNIKKIGGSLLLDAGVAFLENEDDITAKFLRSKMTKTGTSIPGIYASQTFYVGAKSVGKMAKYAPFIGSAIDYGSMILDGEEQKHALTKTFAHAIVGTVIGTAVGTTALPAIGGLLVTVGVGYIANEIIDTVYDKLKKPVGKAVKSVGKWIGSLWK